MKDFAHQAEALSFCATRQHSYALLMQQGTGKTRVFIRDAARRWQQRQIDVLLVLAPSGVHTNWVLREVPQHAPEWLELRMAAWYASSTKAERQAIDAVMRNDDRAPPLRLLAMNWEALTTQKGIEHARLFLKSKRLGAMAVGDESQRIKNPNAKRTRRLMEVLRPLLDVRAIGSGTAILNSPWDAFSQFNFMDERILRARSFAAFKAEYAELLPPGHGLLRHIAQRTRGAHAPQIVARDANGNPKWRNLDRLSKLIAPHSFRVLKKDCLDLPEKVYTQLFFQMTPEQQQRYRLIKEELLLKLDNETILPLQRIASLTKLSQVVSGYVWVTSGTPEHAKRFVPLEENPKFKVLMEEVETALESGEQIIIWARFRNEIADIVEMLRRSRIPCVVYHGDIQRSDRAENIDRFERGEVKVFVGQPAAGGTGITLIAPNSVARQMTVIYFSNTWSLEDRRQSEDRAHRIGQSKSVRYVDIFAQGTIDERIAAALVAKSDLAFQLLDRRRSLELLR